MTNYNRYAQENEDLELGFDPDVTDCESCGIEQSQDEIICRKCESVEAEKSGERYMEAEAGIR